MREQKLKVAGAKAIETDHRDAERKSCRVKNIRIRVDGSLVTYSTFKFLLIFNGLLFLKMYAVRNVKLQFYFFAEMSLYFLVSHRILLFVSSYPVYMLVFLVFGLTQTQRSYG